jgi:hypothetical protein
MDARIRHMLLCLAASLIAAIPAVAQHFPPDDKLTAIIPENAGLGLEASSCGSRKP